MADSGMSASWCRIGVGEGREREREREGEIRSFGGGVAILLLTVPSGQLTQVPSQCKTGRRLAICCYAWLVLNWAGQPKRSETGQGELQKVQGIEEGRCWTLQWHVFEGEFAPAWWGETVGPGLLR